MNNSEGKFVDHLTISVNWGHTEWFIFVPVVEWWETNYGARISAGEMGVFRKMFFILSFISYVTATCWIIAWCWQQQQQQANNIYFVLLHVFLCPHDTDLHFLRVRFSYCVTRHMFVGRCLPHTINWQLYLSAFILTFTTRIVGS